MNKEIDTAIKVGDRVQLKTHGQYHRIYGYSSGSDSWEVRHIDEDGDVDAIGRSDIIGCEGWPIQKRFHISELKKVEL